ncbi:MAG: TolC family protein [Bacteriovoracaceae bacterium]|nr:TolC family protein [Bacteriovoracaceae bacterium]
MKFIILTMLLVWTNPAHAKLNFSEAIDGIFERSPEIPSSQANLEYSEAALLSQKLQLLPSVSAGWSKTETFESVSERSGNFIKTNFNLFKGGSHYSTWKSSEHNSLSAKAGVDQTILGVEYSAVTTILNFIQKAKDKKIFQKLLKINRDSLRTTKRRYKRGLISQQEVIRARVDLGLAKARLKAARIDLNNSMAKLDSLLGHTDINISWPLAKDLLSLRTKKLKNLEFEAGNRPDIKQARMNVIRDTHTVSAAKRSFLPRVDFSYTISNDDINGTDYSEQTSLLSISIPLFDGWKTVSSIKQTQSTLASSQKTLTQRERNAKSDWEKSKKNLVESLETAKERNSNMKLSRKLYKSNFKRFQQGRSSVNDLQVDQNRFLDSESQANLGWLQAHLAWLDFCHTMGKRISNCNL